MNQTKTRGTSIRHAGKALWSLFLLPTIIVAVAVFACSTPAHATQTIPYKINFQGRLTDSVGGALSGSYDMQVKLYTAATSGTYVWGETRTAGNGNAVTVTAGLFNMLIGEGTAVAGSSGSLQAAIKDNSTLYLEVTIGGETLTPRNQLGSSAYAFNADSLDGFDSSDFIQNQNIAQQTTSNFWISGTGKATTFQGNELFGGSSQQFHADTSGNISTTGTATIATNGATALLVQNAAHTADLLKANTLTSSFNVGVAPSLQTNNVINDTMTSAPTGSLLSVATYISGQYVELTHNVGGTHGEIEYTPALSNNFEANFQFYISGAADATYLYTHATSTPTSEAVASGGYTLYFSEWSSKIALLYNGVELKSVTQAGLNNATWHTVKLRKVGSLLTVTYDGSQLFTYADIARTLTGTKFGLGARTGGSAAYHRVRNFTFDNLSTVLGADATTVLGGTLSVQTNTNSTAALSVKDVNGSTILGVDTLNAKITTDRVDGVGFVLNTPTYGGSTDTLLTLQNGGTSKMTVDKDGVIKAASLDTLASGGLNIGSSVATSIVLGQNTTVAANKSLTFASGGGNFDQSASSGTFKTGTGAVSLNGNTTLGSGKTLLAQGDVTLQGASSSANALSVNSSTGSSVFKVDTANSRVGINNSSPSASLDVVGAGPAYTNGLESGLLSPFTTATPAQWNVVSAVSAYAGSYVLYGNYNHDSATATDYTVSLTQTLNSAGTISFYYSCDWNYYTGVDFRVDSGTWNALNGAASNCTGSISNGTTYALASYGVASGSHSFTWRFNRSAAGSATQFGVRVDNINITNVGTQGVAAVFNNGAVGVNLGTGVQPAAILDVGGSIQGSSSLTLGTSSATDGTLVLKNGTNANTVTLQSTAQTGSYTLSIPILAANDTVCTTGLNNCAGTGANTSLSNLTATNINQALNRTSGDLTIQTTTSGNINISPAGTINLSSDAILAATKSLTITGGNTASRPASPTEGMIYYDTTTKQLLTYANGKWQGDRTTSTKIVAASNASQTLKDGADYVVTGNAEDEINAALTAATGGKVYLTEGTYTLGSGVTVPAGTTLAGSGYGTFVQMATLASGASMNLIEGNDNVTIQDMHLDGNKATQSGGGEQYAYYVWGHSHLNFRNNWVTNFKNSGVYLNGGGAHNVITGNHTSANNNMGIFASSSYDTISGNTSNGDGNGIGIYDAAYTTISGNVVRGSTANNGSIDVYTSNNITITGNTVEGQVAPSAGGGIWLNVANKSVVTGNTVQNGNSAGIGLVTGSSYNTISGNGIYNNGGATYNDGIYINASDSNTITGNTMTDTSATSLNYAINISNNTSDTNYLANNTFSTGTINDAGTGTVYGGQVNASGSYLIQPAGATIELQKNTNISGSATVKTTSSAALTVQNASNVDLLVADTSATLVKIGNPGTATLSNVRLFTSAAEVSGTLRIGDATNGVEFSTTGITYRGTARPTKVVTLAPEYAGATFTGDGTNNTGTLTSDFCSSSSLLNVNATACGASSDEHNYYAWTTTQASAQDYDIYIRYRMPSDYDTGSLVDMKIYGWGTTSANEVVALSLYKGSGTACGSVTNAVVSNATWNEGTQASPLGACSIAAGDMVTFKVHLVAGQNNTVRTGEISFTYRTKG